MQNYTDKMLRRWRVGLATGANDAQTKRRCYLCAVVLGFDAAAGEGFSAIAVSSIA